MAYSIEQLRNTPDDELIKNHDTIAPTTVTGVDYFLNELRRREAAREQKTMINLTYAIVAMTLVVTIATIINLLVFISG